jgi:potassium-transporting ATPase ATP-binding subunit
MVLEQLDTPAQRKGAAPEQSEPEVTLRQKSRSAEDRVAAGKARIAEPYGAELLLSALIASLWKFDPRVQIRNPVMFVVWLGAVVTAALTVDPGLFGPSGGSATYNGVVTVILLLTVWFANFAEALAEGRGKAKAASLRRTRMELTARRVLASGEIEQVPATALRKDDMVRVEKGEIIPADGEVIEGVAYVDESAITGESAPVLKEPGTDMLSSVTAGTLLISDFLVICATTNPGESFLDRMIHLVEGAKRQKTPNEMALTVLLAILTLIFLIVVAAMAPVATYLRAEINVADLIALLVALIPTTIGALLSAIGIAGIDRTFRFNVLAMSGKAVEAAGDVHTLLLDKTGTITLGNRQATELIPLSGCSANELVQAAYLASYFDTTPEGQTVVAFAQKLGAKRESMPEGHAGWTFRRRPA